MYDKQRFTIHKELTRAFGKDVFSEDFYLAGGALTSIFSGRPISDFDLFFIDSATQTLFQNKYFTAKGTKPVYDSPNAASYVVNGRRIQLVKTLYGSMEEVVSTFDFTVCQCGYTPKTDIFFMHDSFLEHLAMRLLCYNVQARHPLNSLWRTKKYTTEKGFKLPAVELIKIALTINNLQMQTYHDLKYQLEGIDTVFLKEVTDALIAKKDEAYDYRQALGFIDSILHDKFTADDKNIDETSSEIPI